MPLCCIRDARIWVCVPSLNVRDYALMLSTCVMHRLLPRKTPRNATEVSWTQGSYLRIRTCSEVVELYPSLHQDDNAHQQDRHPSYHVYIKLPTMRQASLQAPIKISSAADWCQINAPVQIGANRWQCWYQLLLKGVFMQHLNATGCEQWR